MQIRGDFPTPTNSGTLASCPTIQFNSDTVYLELASDLTSGLSPTRLPPLQTPVIIPRVLFPMDGL